MTVGALVKNRPIRNGHHVGGDFGWFSPLAVLCGVGLCLGDALLGAGWLVKKCEAEMRDAAWRQKPYLAVGVLVLLVIGFIYALAEHLQIMDRWIERPYLFMFPAIGSDKAAAAIPVSRSCSGERASSSSRSCCSTLPSAPPCFEARCGRQRTTPIDTREAEARGMRMGLSLSISESGELPVLESRHAAGPPAPARARRGSRALEPLSAQ
jgi:hypothetical protein